MASGGARANSGPPPDPNSLRAAGRDAASWTTLPAEGRVGDVPTFPLSRATKRERDLWAREWKRPQAIMWERNGQEVEVALYVRSLVGAEKGDASVSMRTLVKQQQEALGISLPGLARNRWIIAEAAKSTDDAAKASDRPPPRSSRSRFAVIDGGGEA